MTGDVVDDAIFDSFRAVEEQLNVKIANVKRLGHTQDHRSDYMNHITSTILAGDDEYDWVDLMIGNSPTLMNQGIFIDIAQNEYIDLDKPYYLDGLMDQCAIDGKLFFVSGDASLGYMKCAFCMYFNQRLMNEFKIENPYELVDSGKWTLDKLSEIATKAAQDINGDGKYDLEDKLGFVVHESNHPKGFRISTDSVMYKKDSNGEWKFTYGSERDEAIVNKLYKLFFVDEGPCFSGVTNSIPDQLETYNKFSDKFRSGDIFIMTAEMDDSVAQLRNMKDDYGILPYPKYDESDEYLPQKMSASLPTVSTVCRERFWDTKPLKSCSTTISTAFTPLDTNLAPLSVASLHSGLRPSFRKSTLFYFDLLRF